MSWCGSDCSVPPLDSADVINVLWERCFSVIYSQTPRPNAWRGRKQRQKVCWDNSFLLRAFRLPWQLNQNAEKCLIKASVANTLQRFLSMIATRRKFDVVFVFFAFFKHLNSFEFATRSSYASPQFLNQWDSNFTTNIKERDTCVAN